MEDFGLQQVLNEYVANPSIKRAQLLADNISDLVKLDDFASLKPNLLFVILDQADFMDYSLSVLVIEELLSKQKINILDILSHIKTVDIVPILNKYDIDECNLSNKLITKLDLNVATLKNYLKTTDDNLKSLGEKHGDLDNFTKNSFSSISDELKEFKESIERVLNSEKTMHSIEDQLNNHTDAIRSLCNDLNEHINKIYSKMKLLNKRTYATRFIRRRPLTKYSALKMKLGVNFSKLKNNKSIRKESDTHHLKEYIKPVLVDTPELIPKQHTEIISSSDLDMDETHISKKNTNNHENQSSGLDLRQLDSSDKHTEKSKNDIENCVAVSNNDGDNSKKDINNVCNVVNKEVEKIKQAKEIPTVKKDKKENRNRKNKMNNKRTASVGKKVEDKNKVNQQRIKPNSAVDELTSSLVERSVTSMPQIKESISSSNIKPKISLQMNESVVLERQEIVENQTIDNNIRNNQTIDDNIRNNQTIDNNIRNNRTIDNNIKNDQTIDDNIRHNQTYSLNDYGSYQRHDSRLINSNSHSFGTGRFSEGCLSKIRSQILDPSDMIPKSIVTRKFNGKLRPVSSLREASKYLRFHSKPKNFAKSYSKGSVCHTIQNDNLTDLLTLKIIGQFDISKPLDYDLLNCEYISPLKFAAMYGAVKCFTHFNSLGIPITESVLKYAIIGGNNEIIKICEKNGFNPGKLINIAVEYRLNDYVDALLSTEDHSPISISTAAFNGNIEAVYYCLSNGVSVNTVDELNQTPLKLAYQNGHKEVVEFIISEGGVLDI